MTSRDKVLLALGQGVEMKDSDFEQIYVQIADFVKSKRRESGMTLTDMALKTGISASYLYKIENRQSKPGIVVLFRICVAFQVSSIVFLPALKNENKFLEIQSLLAKMSDCEIDEFYNELMKKEMCGDDREKGNREFFKVYG